MLTVRDALSKAKRKLGLVGSNGAQAGGAWEQAQQCEQYFWRTFILHELALSRRDELVGFNFGRGRQILLDFGLDCDDWMYSKTPPVVSGKLLDVGCGPLSVFEKCRSVSVVGIDPMLAGLSRALPEFVRLGKINNCEYRSCIVQDVVEEDFDLVWCNNVLDHTADWREIIADFARVLKPEGDLFLCTDVRSNSDQRDELHIAAFDVEDVRAEVASRGLEVIWESTPGQVAGGHGSLYRYHLRARKRLS